MSTDAWGIDTRWWDVAGNEHEVSEATVTRLREIIGEPTDRGPIIVRTGEQPQHVGHGELTLEDGSSMRVDGALPHDVPLGYHSFRPDDSGGKGVDQGADDGARRVIVSPGHCYLPGGWRAWGWATQLYAMRSGASWGMGDLADLAELARWAGTCGARFVLVNPLGAVHPTTPQQPSPYFPASRRFLNPIYLRVADVPGALDTPTARDAIARAEAAGTALNASRIIDRDEIWRIKRTALEALWAAHGRHDAFDQWYGAQPESLERFATWCALVEQHGPDWHEWPDGLDRPPTATSASSIDDATRDRARFFAWLQWLTAMQLRQAAERTALMQDLPIGVDPHGFDAWEWQDVLALGVTVGAPPDEFNTRGQNWGLPPFVPARLRAADYQPFIETIRASMARDGGLRIDHVMGLSRLWWVPEGNEASDGAYVRYAADDLLAIVALESQRAEAFVVGEDLGTVEDTMRTAMADHDILSYRLLWFEEQEPPQWQRSALAAVTTHDLPTVAGLWTGSDLAAQRDAGVEPNEEGQTAMRDRFARRGHLDENAATDDVVAAAYDLLARAPSVLLAATLDDAVAETERPNIPGGDARRPNWSIALAAPLETIEHHPLAARVAARLTDAVEERSDERHA